MDTPTAIAASAVVTPVAISRQKSRWTALEGCGLPGENIKGRNALSARHCRRNPCGASLVFIDQ
ncbi:hypothetical protein [Luteococcus sp.]|uniref:hypothetical protein n=1 Tax=Luteococcus sp. TaxID=1969402 RepID=UPI003734FF61